MAVTLDQVKETKKTRSAATSSRTTPPFRSGGRALPGRPGALDSPPRIRTRRWASTCTSRSAASGATSATSASTPTRTRDEVETYLDALAREIELYAQAAGDSAAGRSTSSTSAAARRRFSRRAARAPGRRGSTDHCRGTRPKEVTFECEPGTLTEHKLADDQGDGRHAAQPRRRELRRRDPRVNGRAHRSPEIDRRVRLGPRASASRRSTST